jgi:hypothetical protein
MTPNAATNPRRSPNAIDFWRGFALVNIFLSHIPMNAFERLTHRHYSLSDAELFVFLAGWSLRLSVKDGARPTRVVVRQMSRRALRLYKTQIAVTLVALTILALAGCLLGDPSVPRWGNAGALIDEPVRAILGLLMLSQQMQYFDIMPLYIVLSMAAPLLILANRRSPWLLLAASTAIWATAGLLRLDFPSWPTEGHWFFNPLAWQLCFVLGFVLAGEEAPARFARAAAVQCFWPAVAIAVVGGATVAFRWAPDANIVDFSATSLLFSKTYVGPARALHFLSMLIACLGIYPRIERHARIVARVGSMMGRNALPVFVAATLLSLLGRIEKYVFGKAPLLDLCVVLAGVLVLVLTAWVTERRRLKQKRIAPQESLTSSLAIARVTSQATLSSPYMPKSECLAPGVDFALNAELDHAAAQLGRRQTPRVLALGSPSTFDQGASSPDQA